MFRRDPIFITAGPRRERRRSMWCTDVLWLALGFESSWNKATVNTSPKGSARSWRHGRRQLDETA